MTQPHEKVVRQISKLPDPEQDAMAPVVMEELASKKRWEKSIEKSQDLLAKLADRALAEHAAGRTKPL
jgi:hypothetical protein